jgi:hypothetical protein
MGKKDNLEQPLVKAKSNLRVDLTKKSPHDIMHLVMVLKRLEEEGKIKIRKVLSQN